MIRLSKNAMVQVFDNLLNSIDATANKDNAYKILNKFFMVSQLKFRI